MEEDWHDFLHKLWAVEYVVHKAESDRRYSGHLSHALTLPNVREVGGFFGGCSAKIKEPFISAASRLGVEVQCDPRLPLYEFLQRQTPDVALAYTEPYAYLGGRLVKLRDRLKGQVHVISLRDKDVVQLLQKADEFKERHAHILMPGGEWFLGNDSTWQWEMLAVALLLYVAAPDFCPTPSITFP